MLRGRLGEVGWGGGRGVDIIQLSEELGAYVCGLGKKCPSGQRLIRGRGSLLDAEVLKSFENSTFRSFFTFWPNHIN